MLLSLVGKLRLLNNLIRNNKTKAMKKLYILILLMGLSLNLFAERMRYYCEVKGIQKELSAGLKIVFDFGNNPVYSAWGGLKNKQKLVDKDGNEIPFNRLEINVTYDDSDDSRIYEFKSIGKDKILEGLKD